MANDIYISDKVWDDYIAALRKVNDTAAQEMFAYLANHEWFISNEAKQAAIDFAFGLSTKYGEAAAELACEMYDAIMAASSSRFIRPAEPAPTATYNETSKAVIGTMKTNNPQIISDAIGRLVKMAGVDTTMQNALRDGAEWAWIPRGDTCAFCITLASRGWQPASASAIKNGHAEHIHANCDCTYAVRLSDNVDVEGYDPDEYLELYYGAGGGTPEQRINSLRRDFYQVNKDKINEQKRSAYARRKELNSSQAEEADII